MWGKMAYVVAAPLHKGFIGSRRRVLDRLAIRNRAKLQFPNSVADKYICY